MADRNVVTLELTARGDALEKVRGLQKAVRDFVGQSGSAVAGFGRLEAGAKGAGSGFSTAAAGARELTAAASQTSAASGGLRSVLAGFAGGAVGGAVISFFRDATRAAIDFGEAALEASERATLAQGFLQTSAKLTGQSFADLAVIAERVREQFKLSRGDAQELVARAAQFANAAGRPQDTERFLKAVADNAAAAGRSLKELPEILQQLSGGGLEAALDKVLGGKNPSQIFAERFREVGARNAEALTDAQQKALVLNEILERSGVVAGAAAAQLDQFGGRTQEVSARMEDLYAAIGRVIERNRGLSATIDALNKLTSSAADPAAVQGLERVGEAFGGLASVSLGALGVVATGVALLKTGIDGLVGAAVVAATAIGKLGPFLGATIQLGVADALVALQETLPAGVQKALGLAGIDAAKFRDLAKGQLLGIQEELKQLAVAEGSVLVDDVKRLNEFLELSKKGFDFGKQFGKFAPAQSFAGAGAGFPSAPLAGSRVTAGTGKPLDVVDLDALAQKSASAIAGKFAALSKGADAGAIAGLLAATGTQTSTTASGATLLIEGDSLSSLDPVVKATIDAASANRTSSTSVKESNDSLREQVLELQAEIKKLRENGYARIEITAEAGSTITDAAVAGTAQFAGT